MEGIYKVVIGGESEDYKVEINRTIIIYRLIFNNNLYALAYSGLVRFV